MSTETTGPPYDREASLEEKLEHIRGKWDEGDPPVLTFPHGKMPVVADVDGQLHCLHSGLLYAQELSEEDVEDAVEEYGEPFVTRFSLHGGRFTKEQMEDTYDAEQ